MNKRPHSKETEEDILKLEQEFLSKKSEPSVKIIKSENVLSKISNANPSTSKKEDSQMNLVGDIIVKESKKPENINLIKFKSGFPQAIRRSNNFVGKKGSIFSRQKVSKSLNLPSKSFIISTIDSSEIHQQNVDTLSKMTEQQILEEQKKLFDTLDPKLVSFLKSKRQPEKMETENIEPKKVDTSEIVDSLDKNLLENSEKWLNFNKIEAEKLEWMKNVKKPENTEKIYEARFDFNGYILPFSDEITDENRSLFHHGDEPGRPGYTIQELFKLCRSNVQQQRILSLNTLANILSLNSTGIYDSLDINIPVEQIFFIIRICVDENIPSILTSSIKCLHNLYCCQIDETCLDILSTFGGIYEPMLAIDLKEDDREFNDQQLAEMDLVRILVRTNIFIRIRYILNTVKPNTECVNYCLQILIRLARDGNNVFVKLINTENLIESIIQHFVPKIYKLDDMSNTCYNMPVISAIKLLRILCCRSKNFAEIIIDRYNIIDSIISYISIDIHKNKYGLQIQIESFKLLNILFKYNLNLQQFREIESPILFLFNYHIGNTDLTNSFTLQNHFTCILHLLSTLAKSDFNFIQNFIPSLVNICPSKYFTQAGNLTTLKIGNLQILSALLVTLISLIKFTPFTMNNSLEKIVSDFIKSLGFLKITENIRTSSNLLCELNTHKPAPNFKTVEAVMWQTSEHVVPTLNSQSPILFLQSFSEFIQHTNFEIKLQFLECENIKKYLQQLKMADKFNLTDNWFTKCETNFVLNILKCCIGCQNISDTFLYYELAVKCLSILTVEHTSDVEFLLKNIIFNKSFIPADILMSELNLNMDLKNVLNYLDEIFLCYSKVLDLKKVIISNYTLDINIGNIIPVDWIFLPIVYLHTKFDQKQLNTIPEVDQVAMVTSCLQWVYLQENYFPKFSGLEVTEKFCRLSCVFLCSNNIFLDEKIQYLLELNLKKLILNIDLFDFNKNIKGLGNFESFYQQLLEQYQGVSYGNKLFANFILLPTIQKQNIKWRKIVWSQYSGVVETIFLGENDCLINVNEFLTPTENDISLLKSYNLILKNAHFKIRCPFLYFVVTQHIAAYNNK